MGSFITVKCEPCGIAFDVLPDVEWDDTVQCPLCGKPIEVPAGQ